MNLYPNVNKQRAMIMETKVMVKNIKGKDIIVKLYQCNKTLKITGFILNYKGKDCSPSDLNLTDKDYVYLMYNAYSQLNCSFLDVILANYSLCKFYVNSFDHSHNDFKMLSNRLQHVLALMEVVTTYKSVKLYTDCDGVIFALVDNVKKIFKNERAFKLYVTKHL